MTTEKPHDGSVRSFALQLMFVDIMIRDKLVQMMAEQTIHLVWEKLKHPKATAVLNDVVNQPRRPLRHDLRELLAAALGIECPAIADVPSSLIEMRTYPV